MCSKVVELPFIVCICLKFESWFRREQLFEMLYGRTAQNGIEYFTKLDHALFYTYEIMKIS